MISRIPRLPHNSRAAHSTARLRLRNSVRFKESILADTISTRINTANTAASNRKRFTLLTSHSPIRVDIIIQQARILNHCSVSKSVIRQIQQFQAAAQS